MNVKGIAHRARVDLVIQMYGEAHWRRFIDRYSKQVPFWNQQILPLTLIPVETFLAFQDELVALFFGGEPQTYWDFGARSAELSMNEEPFKTFLENTPSSLKVPTPYQNGIKVFLDLESMMDLEYLLELKFSKPE